jgi:hypothetical protein
MSEHVLWSVPVGDVGGGTLLARPGGGCLVCSSRLVAAFDPQGRQLWAAQPAGPSLDLPVIGPGQTVSRIEDETIVVRDLATGALVASHSAPRATGLSVAPGGDLLFSQAAPGSVARLLCIAPTGELRWGQLLDTSAPLAYPPLALGRHMVIESGGSLRGLDTDGDPAWTIRIPGARLASAPVRLSPVAVVLELESDSGPGLYLLGGDPPALTALAVPNPVRKPFSVQPASDRWVLAGQGPAIPVAPGEWEYPLKVLSVGATGATPLWERRLPARPRALLAALAGGLLVTLSPEPSRWQDYHQYYDLSGEMFASLLDSSGGVRWSWHPQRPFTHLPIIDERGTVVLGADDRLWAFPAA